MKSKRGDTIGKLPKINTPWEALREIRKIAADKRGHVLKDDHIEWLELKFKAIIKLADKGLA